MNDNVTQASHVRGSIFDYEADLENVLENARTFSNNMQYCERYTCYTLLKTVFIQYFNYIMYSCCIY